MKYVTLVRIPNHPKRRTYTETLLARLTRGGVEWKTERLTNTISILVPEADLVKAAEILLSVPYRQ